MKKYFLHLYGQSVGPYTFEELRTMNLPPTTPVWFDGLGNWRNANQIPELQSLFVANPQTFYQQQSDYSQPSSRSTNFGNTNLSGTETPKGKSKAGVIIVVILFIVIGAGGFAAYTLYERKKRMSAAIDEMIQTLRVEDSIKNSNAVLEYDALLKADSIAIENDPQSTGNAADDLVGNFNNYNGGTIRVTGHSDQNLKIAIEYVSQSGEKCTGKISGTGTRNSEGKVILRTDEGCKITMTYTGAAFITVDESYNCKSLHGKGCTFEGVYLKE